MAHIVGTVNDDILNGTSDDDVIEGLDGNDTLTAGEGDDTLDGGTGVDTMAGGTGDDVYYVDRIPEFVVFHGGGYWEAGDTAIENPSEGTDEVCLIAPWSWYGWYYLPDSIENLTLLSSGVGRWEWLGQCP